MTQLYQWLMTLPPNSCCRCLAFKRKLCHSPCCWASLRASAVLEWNCWMEAGHKEHKQKLLPQKDSLNAVDTKKGGEKTSKKGGGAHLLTLRWVARLHLQNWESWPIFSRNWAHCHTCPCWWYSDVSCAAPAPRMPCWILIVIPFSDAKWTGLGINTVGQSRCFPRVHSSVTSTPSSFRGFSSCFLSCHCGSAWEVWWKGWVSGNDMLNHLAITVSNTSANLSCASTSQKTGSTEWMWECLPWPCPQREQRMGNRNQEALHELWVCICVCVVYVFINKKVF